MEIFLLAIVTFEVVLIAITSSKPTESEDNGSDAGAS